MKPKFGIIDELTPALTICNSFSNDSSYVTIDIVKAAMRIILDEVNSQEAFLCSYPWLVYDVSDDILITVSNTVKYHKKVNYLARAFINSFSHLWMRNTTPQIEWTEVRKRLYELNLTCNIGILTNQEVEEIYRRLRHDSSTFCY